MAITRGCGERVEGGVYLELPSGPSGRPLEWFMCDPPMRIPKSWGLTPVGVRLVEDTVIGCWHVVDWVGEQHYPNVADFLEESREHGVSRRLSKGLDFSKLGPHSKLILVHRRARINNAREYYEALGYPCLEGSRCATTCGCPKCKLPRRDTGVHAVFGATKFGMFGDTRANGRWEGHDLSDDAMCAGLWYRDVEGAGSESPNDPYRRTLPCGLRYECTPTPADIAPDYEPGVFLVVKPKNLAVIRAPGNPQIETSAMDRATRAGLEVKLENE